MPAPTVLRDREIKELGDVVRGFERLGYITDSSLATVIFLGIKLGKPVLLEGHAGLGKTEAAKALAALLGTQLIRLRCYEGLDINSAVYESNIRSNCWPSRLKKAPASRSRKKKNTSSAGSFCWNGLCFRRSRRRNHRRYC